MPGIIFSEGSGVANSIYGNSQAPIKMMIEEKNKACKENSLVEKVFEVVDSSHWAESYGGLTGGEPMQPVGENGEYPAQDIREGFKKILTNVTWKSKQSISKEMLDDQNNFKIKNAMNRLSTAYYSARERLGASLMCAAIDGKKKVEHAKEMFDTTSADNVCLFSTAHPSALKKANQSNRFKDAFSNRALAHAESAMQLFKDDNDELLVVAPDTIIIPNDPELMLNVFAAVGADKMPDTANNGFNYQFGRWNVIIWNYLNQFLVGSNRPWMLMDSKYNKECLGAILQDREPFTVRSVYNDSNDANDVHARTRFTAGFNDWRAFCLAGVEDGTQLITD